MKYRNYQRNVQRIRGIPELLRKLKEVKEKILFFGNNKIIFVYF
jgi:hypothetical protein